MICRLSLRGPPLNSMSASSKTPRWGPCWRSTRQTPQCSSSRVSTSWEASRTGPSTSPCWFPPRTELPIPVSCLEEGRWGRALSYYRDEAYASPRVRRRSQEGVHSSMEQSQSHLGDQGAVWNEVHHEMRSHEAYSDTVAAADSAKHVYSHDTDRAEAAQELADLGPLPRQCGIAVSHGPWVTAVELFGARHLLAEHWGAPIRSHLLELPPEFRPPSVERALWVVRRFGAMQPQESPSVGLGFELRVRDQKRIGQALTLDGMLAHGSFWMRNGRRI